MIFLNKIYLYHSLSTSLQLEVIKDKLGKNKAGEQTIIKRYTDLKPVITIIWMAESNLGFTEDFVEFNTYPLVHDKKGNGGDGCTDFTDFHGLVRIFSKKIRENP